MAFDDTNFDPVKYGVLWERVQVMDKKMDKMEANLERLIALANQGRGGFWMGMLVVSGFSTVAGWVIHYFTGK